MKGLFLEGNTLTGAIPTELGSLAQLQSLSLRDNTLTGAIPPELGSLAQLQSLSLGSNALTGAIPTELGSLAQLQSLSLRDNTLTGAIPPELGSLAQLKGLRLNGNALTGRLPRSLMQLDSLEVFYFDGQDLCAPQDDEFQAWLGSIPDVRGPACAGTVEVDDETLPESFTLHGNYPNPFRQTTRLVFDLSLPARVTVEVMDVTGRRVFTAPSVDLASGWEHSIELSGATLSSGLYLYRLIAVSPGGSSTRVGRFVVVR